MGKFQGVLLASDFDNTLIYTEDALKAGTSVPELSAGNRQALEYFIAEGGRFAVSTGRALSAFERYAPGLPLNAPCVVCNGAAIYDFARRRYLVTALLEAIALEHGQAVLDAFPSLACEIYHVENTIHAVQPNDITRRHQHMTHVAVEECPSLREVPLPVGKLLLEGQHSELEQAVRFLREKGWADSYELIFSSPFLLEVTARGADKGGMVLQLAELLGISREHVYCAGDQANDLSMLAVAAEGFAPENCIKEVRESGVTVVSDARNDAVADIVRVLDARY